MNFVSYIKLYGKLGYILLFIYQFDNLFIYLFVINLILGRNEFLF